MYEYFEILRKQTHEDFRTFIIAHFGFKKTDVQTPQTGMARFVESMAFTACVVLLIMCNVAWIGYETQTNLQNMFRSSHYESPAWHGLLSIAFATVFTLELAIKIPALRWSFFLGEQYKWNLFDVVMVLSSFGDFLQGLDLRFLRAVRILRMSRVLRVVRLVRFFHDLRQIMCAMLSSMMTLFWATVMMFLVLFIFALFFMQAGTIHIAEHSNVPDRFEDMFGTTEAAVVSLLTAIIGGQDWIEIMHPLERISIGVKYVFICFLIVMIIGMLNVLIGIFSAKALSASSLDRDLVVHDQKNYMSKFLQQIHHLFHEIDSHRTGGITWEQFRDHLKHEHAKTYFLSQGLNVLDARGLFKLIDELDDDPNESIDLPTFTMAMMRLHGQATSTDVYMLLHEAEKHTNILYSMMCDVRNSINSTVPSDALPR